MNRIAKIPITPAGSIPTSDNSGIPNYDTREFTYVLSGNGEGEVETITYKFNGDVVAIETISYDGYDNVSRIVKS